MNMIKKLLNKDYNITFSLNRRSVFISLNEGFLSYGYFTPNKWASYGKRLFWVPAPFTVKAK